MELIRIDPIHPEPEMVARAATCLAVGGSAVFPTDTVYGLGVAVSDSNSPATIFTCKGRDLDKAIPWLVSGIADLARFGRSVPDQAFTLARRFWPGALTIIVQASDQVPPMFLAEDGSIALRSPAHKTALALIAALEAPLATSSANLQGQAPATSLDSLDEALVARVDVVIDGGETPGNVPSTIVSCLNGELKVIREGVISTNELLLHWQW